MPRCVYTFKSSVARIFHLSLLLLLCSALLPAQDSAAHLREGFLNPPDDAKAMMRWWWFGPAVVKPELEKELETMRGAGIGGVEIQPVYPLMLDDPAKGIDNLRYLSPEFLDDVTFANKKAHDLGLRVSITLGSGWPYGGPSTTLALAAGRLKVVSIPVHNSFVAAPKLPDGDSVIAAFLVSGTEKSFDPATAKRFDPAGQLPSSTDDEIALYFVSSHTKQMVKRAAFGAEGYVLDHFSRAALDEHLTDVAAPLLKSFGNEPPYSVFSDSLEVYGSDWTPDLPAEFKQLRGYDLIPHLPELLAGGTPEADAVRHDWGETLSELIRRNYLEPLTQFAKQHGTQFRSQTYGEPAVTLADEAIPSLPEGEGPQWRAFSFSRWATSASHLYGRNVTSAETWTWLHSPAFRATPLDMKAEADRMFLMGINQFVGHGYPYSPPAAGEPGWAFYAAAVFNAHNPWFPVMPDVMRYMQRVSWLLRQGQPANDVAILLPEDDAQAAFTPGHVSVTDEMRTRISPELMNTILDAGYNIDYIDATTINKLGVIPYPILIIPSTDRIPLTTYEAISAYAATGKVIAIGKLPSLAPGLMDQNESPQVAALSKKLFRADGHKGIFIEGENKLADMLHQALPPDVDAKGQTAGLGFIHRKLANSDIYFIANTGNQPIDAAAIFRTQRRFAEAWDPDSGRVLFAQPIGNGTRIPLLLAPYESRVFVFSGHRDVEKNAAAQSTQAHEQQIADLNDGWHIQFADSPSSQALNDLISWTEIPGRQNYSGEADYTRSITLPNAPARDERILLDFGNGAPTVDNRPIYANGLHALLDPPIREAAVIYVNGQRAGSLWHPPYRIDITQLLHGGGNRIEVRVYNTAINLLAGQPPHDYSALYAKYGKRFEPQDMENLHPIPSGLFGPIRLLRERSE
jgi:hypothetical protein